ncbi:MAG: hypothetical protein ACNA7V_10535 [Bacteroidales bacterium]
MGKKILIVSRSYHPVIAPRSFRATQLAEEFSRQGHSVTVMTHKQKNFDYKNYSREKNIRIEDFVGKNWIDIGKSNFLLKVIRKILNVLFLYPEIQIVPILKKYLINERGYDLLISIAVPYPVHWGVALAKDHNPELTKVWVADCGDPFMGNKEMKIQHPFYFHFVEMWFCKKPDYLTVPIKEAINAYPVSARKKIKVIPQGFNFKKPNFIKDVKNEILTFGYAGLLSKDRRDPKQLFDYLLKNYNKEFRFIIYTKSLDVIKPYDELLGNKIEIRDYIPRTQLLEELCKMDFLVNFENLNKVQSPSKLIDYALTGRPILSIKSTNMNEDIVDEFMNRNYNHKYVIGNMDDYNIKNVAEKFIRLTL